nr:pathogen-related protein-like [Ipomoea batatas]
MADGVKMASDKYRSFLHEERGNIQWRHGAAPTYDAVNELFEQGRTQVWAEGSLEETTSLPEEFKVYKSEEESFESSHDVFRLAFPRGFAWEVMAVYSGPPVVTYKFRHWGYFEGPFKGHSPTGELVQFYGLGIMKVDESLRAEEVEIYYDPAELLGGLLKGTDSNVKQCPFHK